MMTLEVMFTKTTTTYRTIKNTNIHKNITVDTF